MPKVKLTMDKYWRNNVKQLRANGEPTGYRIIRYRDGKGPYDFVGPDGECLKHDIDGPYKDICAGSSWYRHGPISLRLAYEREHGKE